MTKRICYIILVILWVLIICFFSSEPASISSERSLQVTNIINEYADLNLSENSVRKLAHLFVYFILGVCLFVCFGGSSKGVLCSAGLGIPIAILDELHQYFVPGRGMLVSDMIINSTGLILGILIASGGFKMIKKIQELISRYLTKEEKVLAKTFYTDSLCDIEYYCKRCKCGKNFITLKSNPSNICSECFLRGDD